MKFIIIFAIAFEFIYKYFKSEKSGLSTWDNEKKCEDWQGQSFVCGHRGIILFCIFMGVMLGIDMGLVSYVLSDIPKSFLLKYFDLLFYLTWTITIVALYKKELILEIKAVRNNFEEKMGFSTLVLIISLAIMIVVNVLLGSFGVISQNEKNIDLAKETFPVIVFIYSIVLGPFVEEIIYRGILFRKISGSIKRGRRVLLAHVVAAIIFALSHAYVN